MTSSVPYLAFIVLHILCCAAVTCILVRSKAPAGKAQRFLLLHGSEILFSLTLVFFLFIYIYATNANMDYVQRFMTSHGNLRLAPNSRQERLAACLRYLPLLTLDVLWYVLFRLSLPLKRRSGSGPVARFAVWALPLTLLSGTLMALSFPSFLNMKGIPILGWFCLVPLIVALADLPFGWGVFYGTFAGVLQTMISNYWLGTFNLLTLQFVSVVTLVQYIPFMAIALPLLKRSRGLGFLALPAAWTIFDWLRSLGFLGYPWGMLGASQYTFIPLIQVAALTGVWGVTFIVTLANSTIAWYLHAAGSGAHRGPTAVVVSGAVIVCALGFGGYSIAAQNARAGGPPRETVRLSLVQQNADPRKDDYAADFKELRRLTDAALASDPDLVVWSETAFVPNIRRWSEEDPAVYPLASLVQDFLTYQKSTKHWLLTGNDDYSLVQTNGVTARRDYNGAVLFSSRGQRVETYHKIHLVPFTEYFPYKKELPGLFAFLQSFDATLWEPGDSRIVFRHPKFTFSTPICFEDVFPDDVRRFVRQGAQVIINLSNDYWSLTETEGMQHAANAVFRAVENARPIARAAASGLTCLVDPLGRITARSPLYEQSVLTVDIPLSMDRWTLYSRWGDWFPPALFAILLLLLGVALIRPRA